jgi:predicted SnoaL-like aldol condensation-catalyzing enzyme
MKKTFLFAMVSLFSFGCNSGENKTETKAADNSAPAANTAVKYEYPYTLDKPYQDWQPGDQKHAVTAMSSLKGFENGDINAAMAGFGDSIEVRFDYFQQKFSKDSLTKFFTAERAKYSSIKINMGDWESVISKDGKTQWVTMWYKQITTDKKGKTDSLAVIDDCRIVDGKIVELDEKIQHYPAKK